MVVVDGQHNFEPKKALITLVLYTLGAILKTIVGKMFLKYNGDCDEFVGIFLAGTFWDQGRIEGW